MDQSATRAAMMAQPMRKVLQNLGFVINLEMLHLFPSQSVTFLGFTIDDPTYPAAATRKVQSSNQQYSPSPGNVEDLGVPIGPSSGPAKFHLPIGTGGPFTYQGTTVSAELHLAGRVLCECSYYQPRVQEGIAVVGEILKQPTKAGNQRAPGYLVDLVGQLQSEMGGLVQGNTDRPASTQGSRPSSTSTSWS